MTNDQGPMTKGRRAWAVAGLVARLALAGVMGWAAVGKLAAPAQFVRDLANYQLVPVGALGALVWFVPALEIAAVAGLLVPTLRRGGLALTGGLLLVFCAALGSALVRGIDLRCGCFGSAAGAGAAPAWALARNGVLLMLVAIAALGEQRRG